MKTKLYYSMKQSAPASEINVPTTPPRRIAYMPSQGAKFESRRLLAPSRLVCACLLLAAPMTIGDQTGAIQPVTSFCYQGYLMQNGAPANGSFYLRLGLYEVALGGYPMAGPVTNANVAVIDGFFAS